MSEVRRIQAIFQSVERAGRAESVERAGRAERAEPGARAEADEASGVVLEFRPVRARLDVESIRDFAELGPALTIPAVAGIGKVLRILRAARIAAPSDPLSLVGRDAEVEALLGRALGTRLLLSVRRRARLSFVAWTERGVETVPDVVDVIEDADHYLVMRRGTSAPLRFPRALVSRGQTQRERWYEVVGIERPG